MKKLEQKFTKNGHVYEIIDRTQTRYIAQLFSLESGNCVGIETGRIMRQKARTRVFDGKTIDFEEKEIIPSNEQFGKDPTKCEKCMRADHMEKIEAYFQMGIRKEHLGKKENAKEVPTTTRKK